MLPFNSSSNTKLYLFKWYQSQVSIIALKMVKPLPSCCRCLVVLMPPPLFRCGPCCPANVIMLLVLPWSLPQAFWLLWPQLAASGSLAASYLTGYPEQRAEEDCSYLACTRPCLTGMPTSGRTPSIWAHQH